MATETFQLGGEQVTVTVDLDLGGETFTLTGADMANPTAVFAAIPSGTASAPVTVLLPAGEFVTDASVDISDKTFWNVQGGPTTFRFPTYGPATGTIYQRRHVRISRCSDLTLSRIKVWGPHTVRHATFPTRALYQLPVEFQHGFQIGYCQRVTLSDVEVYEVGGDGVYILDSDDVTFNRMRVEFNGRQGIAGIGGNRWLFSEVEIVDAARFAVDLEPIGNFADGTTRWVVGADFANSKLKGGMILHRVTDVTLRNSEMRRGGVITAAGNNAAGNLELSQRRSGIKILNNVWPELWSSPTADAGPIRMELVNGLEVRGNTVNRDPNHAASANTPLVEMISGPVNGHFVVRGNVTNLPQLLKWRFPIPAGVTTDVGV